MTVWSHLPTIFNQRRALRIAGLLTLCVALITTLFFSVSVHAAEGINKTIGFQGRLQRANGAIVPDGYYNMEFKIYQDGPGTHEGNPGGTLEWSESYVNNSNNEGVRVKNGYFSVDLGSETPFGNSVDWNQDTLWLSINVAGDSASCTAFDGVGCAADGEMLPMKRMTAVPYAMNADNANKLGGKSASEFIQNGTSPQTADINITGTATAGALQSSSLDTASAGTLTIGGANTSNITIADDATVASGKGLTLSGGATNTRPASPSEGTLYYDTDTKKLLVYTGGKWQTDRTDAVLVASSTSSQADQDAADFVADGNGGGAGDGDQVQINSALTAAAGKKVVLLAGNYEADGTILVPNNTTLMGVGSESKIELRVSGLDNLIENSDQTNGTGIVIRNLKLDGRKDVNTSGTQRGIRLAGIGKSSTGTAGAKVENVTVENFRNTGIYLATAENSSITGNTVRNNDEDGIGFINSSLDSTVSGNTVSGNLQDGINIFSSSRITISGNNIKNSGEDGIVINTASKVSALGNTVENNADSGIKVNKGTDNLVNGNMVGNNGLRGIYLWIDSNDNTVSDNKVYDNGGSTASNGIRITGSNDNTITGNKITDTDGHSSTNYSIDVSNSASNRNYLADNAIDGTINNAGTGTVYGGQVNGSSNYVIQPAGTVELQANTNVTGSLGVTGSVLTPSVDTASAGALSIGSANATSITIGKTSSNITTSIIGNLIVKPSTGNDSTTAFQLQRANGTAMLVGDSVNQTLTIGDPASANRIVISTATGQMTKFGTARNSERVTLTAEYAGSVLDAGSGSNNTGTMTSGVDLSERMNYYKWTTSEATNQNYDVVAQVPIPAGFDGWAGANPLSISAYTTDTTNGTISVEARDSSGTVRCNFVSITPGSTNTWTTNSSACDLSSGTYTPGNYLTLRIRMQSPNGGNVRIGNINLDYFSKR